MRALTPAERAEAGRELDRRTFAAREAEMQAALDQMQAAVTRARAELAAYHAAAESTDLEGDVREALADLAEWDTEDRCAPDWLVDAVIGLLAPLKAERDQRTQQVTSVRTWLDSDVVTARNEFGSGYREAIRDVRDLLDGAEAPNG